MIRTDYGSEFASYLFSQFGKEWSFNHIAHSPRNSRSNGQAKATVEIMKYLLTCAKYSGEDPYLTILAYRSTPTDSHLYSLVDSLYQRAVHSTVLQSIRHNDPQAAADHDHLNKHATQSAAYHDCNTDAYVTTSMNITKMLLHLTHLPSLM